MKLSDISAVVTGGSSGLGAATARLLARQGSRVVITDRAEPSAELLEELGPQARFHQSDITDAASLAAAFDEAEAAGPLRAVVHCAGRGGDRLRILDREGNASPEASFADVVRINLTGTYNVLRLAAERIARTEPVGDDRGSIVLTASVAAFDGQVGQTAYSASKGGVHAMTLVAARDLAAYGIRVNTIAPGTFDTTMLARFPDEIRARLGAAVPHPSRLGHADEFADMAVALLTNGYANGATLRLDGAIRMAPR
ncbi:SDR family NAD(P)-dependent oxidoreductase [Pseudonocardia sp. McavD-2-B]|uniref:SDR family NAD(P)-dependent oxidoreductase n=1 Tax=Pseudonocardia sp. McavD-2-B TaxID=2954499 RepID=UPI0020973171|nr:SDR family NAD(P)-dependent oxidoreductase [Pseudonocardia sp. McavD-2-B]MCO7191500.1 SDR family NAD(P)-dependent oxidoreductase [Pseudonocardia sp. McavD-2-B]